MPFLPIAERELRVAARKRATYQTRFWAVLIALVAFSWQLLTLIRQNRPSTTHGKYLFVTLSVVAFVYSLFIGARVTADCLSEEKREGTLGLLFLTDLKGYDVVIGKLVASSVNAFYGLIAIFPMLAICLLLGGISFTQFAQTILVLITTLFFSLTVGIFVSTYNHLERLAMFFTILMILSIAVGPFLVGFVLTTSFGMADEKVWSVLLFSPAFALLLATEPQTAQSFAVPAFSFSIVSVWLLTFIFLRHASLKVPKSWQEKNPRAPASRLKTPVPEGFSRRSDEEKDFRKKSLDRNPFFWLALRGPQKCKHAWGFILSIIVIWILGLSRAHNVMWDYYLLFPTVLFIHAFLKIWVTSEACTRLVEDRRSGALELLLSTPLDEMAIIRGQHLALLRQFAAPLSLLIVLEIICVQVGMIPSERVKFFLLAAAVLLAIDFLTLRWVAMWIGLTSKNVNRAVLKTAALVLAAPWIIYNLLNNIFPFFWPNRSGQPRDQLAPIVSFLAISLLINFILYFWSKTNLLEQFRFLATEPVRVKK